MKRGWQPIAGLTWELWGIAAAWSLAFGALPVVVYRVLRGASPSALFWTLFWCYFAATYKLTAWMSNKYRARQRQTVISAQALLSNDPRPPVLYLRSFKDDETTSRLLNLSTEEQELALVMLELGPFIAFGEPGEDVPEPGAARLYAREEDWRRMVEDLMSRAQLVVARVGKTDSFWWEMWTAVQLVKPEKLLLLIPEDKDTYEEFRRKARGLFPCPLPEHEFIPTGHYSKSHISVEGLLYFEPDWTPHLQKLKSPNLRQNYWTPGAPIFKTALRPVYGQLGVEWKRPPLQVIQILPLILLLLSALFVIYVFVLQAIQLLNLIREQM